MCSANSNEMRCGQTRDVSTTYSLVYGGHHSAKGDSWVVLNSVQPSVADEWLPIDKYHKVSSILTVIPLLWVMSKSAFYVERRGVCIRSLSSDFDIVRFCRKWLFIQFSDSGSVTDFAGCTRVKIDAVQC